MACHDLEQGSDRIRFVGFEVDAHRCLGKSLEGLRETRNRVVAEIVASDAGCDVPLLHLIEGARSDVLRDPGHSLPVRIVGDHEVAIDGWMDIDLERIGAIGQRPLKRGQGVLRQMRRRPAVAVETKSIFSITHAAHSSLHRA